MLDLQAPGGAQWLSLREACSLLQVNQTTLRQWADQGHLRVYRTPGGHRRFSRDDVLALTQRTTPVPASRDSKANSEDSALRRIRRGLHHHDVTSQPWYQSIEEEGRGRLRLFGRRLLSLLVHPDLSGQRRQRQEALAESRLLGQEYGAEMADRGVALTDTLEAFVFFRTMVLDSTDPQAWGPMLELADRVMVGMAEGYQRRQMHPQRHPQRPMASPAALPAANLAGANL